MENSWVQPFLNFLIVFRFPGKLSFPTVKFDQKLSREALPLSLVFIGMISFNNLCLREVGVAFYTVARSLVTLFSIIFTYIILGMYALLKITLVSNTFNNKT